MPSMYDGQMETSWVSNDRGFDSSPAASRRHSARLRSIPQSSAIAVSGTQNNGGHATSSRQRSVIRRELRKNKIPKDEERDNKTTHIANMLDITAAGAQRLFGLAFEILITSLRLLKIPLSLALAALILYFAATAVTGSIAASIHASLLPLCQIPGAGLLNLPFCRHGTAIGLPVTPKPPAENAEPVDFGKLMQVQSTFEEVLAANPHAVSLQFAMKLGEVCIRELRPQVRYSQLPSRGKILLELSGFIQTASLASDALLKFNTHIGSAADMVIANTQSTKEALDRIPLEPGSPGVLSRTFRAVIPFYHDPRARAKAAIVAQYHKHLHHVQDEIDILLIEANTILGFLYALENHLDSIYKFASEDNAQVQLSRDEILGHLWTLTGIWNTITGASSTAVGGWRLSNLIGRGSGSREGGSSRSKLSDYDRQIGLLRHVTENRKSVWAHVTGVIMKLKTMHAGLENLHERTNATKYRRDGTDIPLSVHLGYVQRGAERLEAERKRSKKMEDDVVKKILDLAHGR